MIPMTLNPVLGFAMTFSLLTRLRSLPRDKKPRSTLPVTKEPTIASRDRKVISGPLQPTIDDSFYLIRFWKLAAHMEWTT
jgi:hypothetical protein